MRSGASDMSKNTPYNHHAKKAGLCAFCLHFRHDTSECTATPPTWWGDEDAEPKTVKIGNPVRDCGAFIWGEMHDLEESIADTIDDVLGRARIDIGERGDGGDFVTARVCITADRDDIEELLYIVWERRRLIDREDLFDRIDRALSRIGRDDG